MVNRIRSIKRKTLAGRGDEQACPFLFQDTYRNLTLKTVMGLKWSAIFCPQARHVMKTDDDIFVNVPLLHGADLGQKDIIGCIKNGQVIDQMS